MCTAAGIWTTHFVGILAYAPSLPVNYDPVLIIASLLIAAIAATAGFAISLRVGRPMVAAGGAIIGTGIALTHFAVINARVIPGMISWDSGGVGASILIGIALGSAALLVWHALERRKAVWIAPALLALAICMMHFIGISAAAIAPNPTIVVPPLPVDDATLAIAVIGVAALALLATTLIVSEGKRNARARNQELVDAAHEGLVIAKDGIVVNVNRCILDLTLNSPTELQGKRV
jgi:NO-binding membrane sensor protein with MHYT domain